MTTRELIAALAQAAESTPQGLDAPVTVYLGDATFVSSNVLTVDTGSEGDTVFLNAVIYQ